MAKITIEINDGRLSEIVAAYEWLAEGEIEVMTRVKDEYNRLTHTFAKKKVDETDEMYLERVYKAFGKIAISLKRESEANKQYVASVQAIQKAKAEAPTDLYV